MKFPMINDESELNRLITTISNCSAKKTATEVLMQLGKIKPYMTKAECWRMSSERKVETAIKRGELPFVAKGRSRLIERKKFESWLTKDTLL